MATLHAVRQHSRVPVAVRDVEEGNRRKEQESGDPSADQQWSSLHPASETPEEAVIGGGAPGRLDPVTPRPQQGGNQGDSGQHGNRHGGDAAQRE
jgi:photosystem II stability/assembly factor-like uncharacterized protein